MLRGKDSWMIVAAVFIFGILAVIYFTADSGTDDLYQNLLGEERSAFEDDITVVEDHSGEESVGERNTSSGGGGGGDGGGGSSSSSGGSENCVREQISYSMVDFNKTELCNSYSGEICIDKTVFCDVEIQNRDSAGGDFEVGLFFVERYQEMTDQFDSKIRMFQLGGGQDYFFNDTTNIQSSGADGLANKQINCYFISMIVPTKEICEQ